MLTCHAASSKAARLPPPPKSTTRLKFTEANSRCVPSMLTASSVIDSGGARAA